MTPTEEKQIHRDKNDDDVKTRLLRMEIKQILDPGP
jgi:hypothetical protein